MKLATLACLAALCLAGLPARAAPGEQPKPATAPSADATHAPAATGETASQASPRPPASARAERRRRSYAACNRASHQRGLRGGKRRRFLIRCRLGYERTRGQAVQSPAAGQPAQPGRKP
jgi:hypothetical protein